MIVDCFTYNGEEELLDLHLNTLKPYVDKFICVQSPTTFTGKPKPIYPVPNEVELYVNDENYTAQELELAYKSPNTRGAEHWKHEFLQKERIQEALKDLKPQDTVFVGDVDEIWSPDALNLKRVHKLKLRVYTYWLNNRSNEQFWGTLKAPYAIIKDSCLNHLRTFADKTNEYYGWHFTSMGDLREKLEAQYTDESYLTSWVSANLEENREQNKDFLGRNFEFTLDESDWPLYLKENKLKYKKLCR